MTFDDAASRLRDGNDPEAAALILASADRAKAAPGAIHEFADDAAADAVAKYLAKLRAGLLDHVESKEAYLRLMVRNRSIDLWRRTQRRLPVPPSPQPPAPPTVDASALDEVVAKARSMRDDWQRHHLDRGWEELRRLLLEDVDLVTVLRDSGEPVDTPDDLRRARQRAWTAHRRLRVAMRGAAEELHRIGRFDHDHLADVLDLIGRLRRR